MRKKNLRITLTQLIEQKGDLLCLAFKRVKGKNIFLSPEPPLQVCLSKRKRDSLNIKGKSSNVIIIGEKLLHLIKDQLSDRKSTLSNIIKKNKVKTLVICSPSGTSLLKSISFLKKTDLNILLTKLSPQDFIHSYVECLKELKGPNQFIHGVLLDINGVGILIKGKSGIGKSEIALELIMRGARLVSDDIVEIVKKNDELYGTSPSLSRYHMEIRGLGIINIKDLFGVSAVRGRKKIETVIELLPREEYEEEDVLGLDERECSIMNVKIPLIKLPIAPGRNVAAIVEVAARNFLLKRSGVYSSVLFQEQLDKKISREK